MDMIGTLVRLADLGVTGVKVTYDGSGDSGAIEEIIYTMQKLDEDEEAAFDEIEEIYAWEKDSLRLMDLDSGIASDIDSFVEDALLQNIEDWWNNEGGSGSVCIIIPSGKYKIFNNIRITHIENYVHEGSLIDKTL